MMKQKLFGFGNCNLHPRPKYSNWSALFSSDVVIKMHNYRSVVYKNVYLARFKNIPPHFWQCSLPLTENWPDKKLIERSRVHQEEEKKDKNIYAQNKQTNVQEA